MQRLKRKLYKFTKNIIKKLIVAKTIDLFSNI